MDQYCKNCGMKFTKKANEIGNCPICKTFHDQTDEFVGVPGGLPDSRPLTPQERKKVVDVVVKHFSKQLDKRKK